MDLIEVKEGQTAFFVPVQDESHPFPPKSTPIFFNPRMELSRDATVLLVTLLKPRHYLDAMGATGVRGLRVANECGTPVTINDRSREAADLIEKNRSRANLPLEVTCKDVNVLLSDRRFDAVDVDPFGSPAFFLDAAARSAWRYLFVTATDTAPLCGAHLRAGMRRYAAVPRNTEYHQEVGLRILLGFVARETVKYDRGIEPVYSFAREHFVRLHLRLQNGASAADRTVDRLGYVLQCPDCPCREEVSGLLPEQRKCGNCGKELRPIGPLWLGRISDAEILAEMHNLIGSMPLGKARALDTLLTLCMEELETASFYDYHALSKFWGVSPPPIGRVLERLREEGFRATRTHFSGTGIKTDAPLKIIGKALRPG